MGRDPLLLEDVCARLWEWLENCDQMLTRAEHAAYHRGLREALDVVRDRAAMRRNLEAHEKKRGHFGEAQDHAAVAKGIERAAEDIACRLRETTEGEG